MGVAITIRNVPDGVRDELAARAARRGQSLQEYLRSFLTEAAAKPTVDEWVARVRARSANYETHIDPQVIVDAVHADRR